MFYHGWFIDSDLPRKLEKEEFLYYMAGVKNGDKEARNIIINSNIRLVLYRVSYHFSYLPYDKEELVSIGLMGLVKSVDTFDASKKCEFSTYAIRCIDNEILMFARKKSREPVVISIDEVIANENEGDKALRLQDTLKETENDLVGNYEDKELASEIRALLETLPEKEKEITMLYFGFYGDKPYSQKQIANKLNISQAHVSRLLSKTLRTFRNQLCPPIEPIQSVMNEKNDGKDFPKVLRKNK